MADAIDALVEALGADTVRNMAAIFVAEWQRQRDTIAQTALAPSGPARAAQRQAAHDLVTNAGSLGFEDLSAAARRLEQAVVNADALEVSRAAAPIEALADRARLDLEARLGPL